MYIFLLGEEDAVMDGNATLCLRRDEAAHSIGGDDGSAAEVLVVLYLETEISS